MNQESLNAFLGKAVNDLGAVSLARQGPGLGAQAGEQRLRRVVVDGGGFTRFRRAAETPFNIVLEARPRSRVPRAAGPSRRHCYRAESRCLMTGKAN
jgi:hypothetical protein